MYVLNCFSYKGAELQALQSIHAVFSALFTIWCIYLCMQFIIINYVVKCALLRYTLYVCNQFMLL